MKQLSRLFLAAALALVALAGPARAAGLSDYLELQVINHVLRTGTWAKPGAAAAALIVANKGYWAASTAYAANDYVLPATPNGRLYKAAGACTSGASAPSWGTTAGGSTTDNTCTWVEQTNAIEAGSWPEVANAGAYARVAVTQADANWSAPTAGTGSGTGQTSNVNAIAFPAPTGNWGVIYGVAWTDSATYGAGNTLFWAALTTPKTVNNGDAAPSFAAGQMILRVDD